MIHYFNPGHETAVLNGSDYYMAPANVVTMQRELSFLPAWYASEQDYVLVEDNFPIDYYHWLKSQFEKIPVPVTNNDIVYNPNKYAGQEICLWGISPQSIYFFEQLNTLYGLRLKLPVWKEIYKKLNSRQTAHDCLKYIIKNNDSFSCDLLPAFFTDLREIEKYIANNPSTRYIAKAPYSSSGRGLLWLPQGELTRTERQILHGNLKKQGAVSLEKALNKKLDFAMEFYIGRQSVRFEGISLFQTNNKGAYAGNYLFSQEKIICEINKFIDADLLEKVQKILTEYISNNISPHYEGYAGIDMLIYEENGTYQLQPCVEINLRSNMGILALHIHRNIIAHNSTGFFRIDFNAKQDMIYLHHQEMSLKHPAVFENRKMVSGYLPLCPVKENNKYNAYMLVENSNFQAL